MFHLRTRSLRLVGVTAAVGLLIAVPRAQDALSTDGLIEVQPQWSAERAARVLQAVRTGAPYVPGEVLVKFRAGTTPGGRQASLTAVNASADGDAQWLGELLLVRVASEPDAERLAWTLTAQPDVEYAVPNYVRQLHGQRPDDRAEPAPPSETCDAPVPKEDDAGAERVCGRDASADDARNGAAASAAGDTAHAGAAPQSMDPAQPNDTAAARPDTAASTGQATNAVGRRSASARGGATAAVPTGAGPIVFMPRASTTEAAAPAPARAATGSSRYPTAPLTASRPGDIVRPPAVPLVPNDLNTTQQWNFSLLNMPAAWDINPGGSSQVVVAVIDSGVTTVNQPIAVPLLWNGSQLLGLSLTFSVNPDLESARLTSPRDFTFVQSILGGPSRVLDMDGHGTHVAGTIAQSTDNAAGGAGIAYRTRIMPLKICVGFWEVQMLWAVSRMTGTQDVLPFGRSGCTDDALVAAIRYAADQGARVINLSLGSGDDSPAILDALRYAVNRGAFVVMSAGNSFDEGNPVNFPAAYAPGLDGAVAVAAIDRNLQRSYYSSTGPYVTVAAPGGDVRGGTAGGIHQMSIDRADFHPSSPTAPRFNAYRIVSLQGTSMAAPHVSGAAALLIAQGISNPAAVEAALKRFARDIGAPGPDHEFGYGLIQPRETLRGLGLLR